MPHIVNDGVTIHYRVEGHGAPLVLEHGFTDSSDYWFERGFVEALKPKYRLVLIDARGHGQSDKPHDPASYTPAKFASDIVAVLDDTGIQTASYWGYSQGGWMAFCLARHALDRVACFVVGGASASTASAFPAEPGKEDPLLAQLRDGPDAMVKHYGNWMTPQLRKRLQTNDAAALIACRQQRLITEGFADVVGKIAVPVLCYAGTADPIHEPARQSAAQIRGAEFVSLPGLDHIAAGFRSDLVLPHVERFLERARG
jgi:pimeloyl-ACP methyl ester carboxylesterase